MQFHKSQHIILIVHAGLENQINHGCRNLYTMAIAFARMRPARNDRWKPTHKPTAMQNICITSWKNVENQAPVRHTISTSVSKLHPIAISFRRLYLVKMSTRADAGDADEEKNVESKHMSKEDMLVLATQVALLVAPQLAARASTPKKPVGLATLQASSKPRALCLGPSCDWFAHVRCG